jgi:WD40 repeat protein
MMFFGSGIEQAPLQAYESAMFFAPRSSLVRMNFLNQNLHWITTPEEAKHSAWPACRQVVEVENYIEKIAFMSHGRSWLSASRQAICLYDSVSGVVLQTADQMPADSQYPREPAIAAEGRLVATPTVDGIYIWNIEEGMIRHTLKDAALTRAPAVRVAFTSDGALLASISDDHVIRIWDTHLGVCLKDLRGHTSSIEDLSFSPDGSKLASLAPDTALHIWDVDHGSSNVRPVTYDHRGSGIVKFSHDGQMLAYSDGNDIILLHIDEERIAMKSAAITALDFSPDNTKLVSGSASGCLQTWDTSTGKAVCKREGYQRLVSSVRFAKHGNSLISFAEDQRTIDIWDAARLERISILNHPLLVRSFDVSTTTLLSLSSYGTTKLWDLAAVVGQPMLSERPFRFDGCFVSPSGNLVVADSDLDQRRMIFDAATGQKNELKWSAPATHTRLIFSPDERFVAFFTKDDGPGHDCHIPFNKRVLQVWDIARSHMVHSITYEGLYEGKLQGFEIAVLNPGSLPPAESSIVATLWDMMKEPADLLSPLCNLSLRWQATARSGEVVVLDRDGFLHSRSTIDDLGVWTTQEEPPDPTPDSIFCCASKGIIGRHFAYDLLEVLSMRTGHVLWGQSCHSGRLGNSEAQDFSPNGDLLAARWTQYLVLFDSMTGESLYYIDLARGLYGQPSFPCFATDGSGLHFKKGFLSVTSKHLVSGHKLDPTVADYDLAKLTGTARQSVLFDDDWLYIDDVPRLWLPEQYRIERITVNRNSIFAVHKDGSSSIWQLNF